MRSTVIGAAFLTIILVSGNGAGQRGNPALQEQALVEAAKSDALPGALPALGNLARFYKNQNRPADEAEVYSRIVKLWSKAAGSRSVGVARYLAERGRAEAAAGMTAQSDASFKESLALLKTLSLDKSLFGYSVLASYGNSLSVVGKTGEAEAAMSEALDGMGRLMGKVTPLVTGSVGPAFANAYRAKYPNEPRPAEPIKISGSNPAYSDEARKARVSGDATLIVEISDAGIPVNVWVWKSLGLGLDEKAIEAAREWRFKPGVSTIFTAEIAFQLR